MSANLPGSDQGGIDDAAGAGQLTQSSRGAAPTQPTDSDADFWLRAGAFLSPAAGATYVGSYAATGFLALSVALQIGCVLLVLGQVVVTASVIRQWRAAPSLAAGFGLISGSAIAAVHLAPRWMALSAPIWELGPYQGTMFIPIVFQIVGSVILAAAGVAVLRTRRLSGASPDVVAHMASRASEGARGDRPAVIADPSRS